LLETHELTGYGTASYRFVLPPGGFADVEIVLERKDTLQEGFGLWLYSSDGVLLDGLLITSWGRYLTDRTRPYLELHAELPKPVGVLFHYETTGDEVNYGFSTNAEGMEPGEYVLILGGVSDGAFLSGETNFHGTEGVEILDRAVTPGGFFHDETDFRGTNVLAGNIKRAGAMAGAEVTENVDNLLYGLFWTDGVVPDSLSYEGPEGKSAARRDHFFIGTPPGDYTFRVRLDAYVDNHLWVWGVFARPV
jgi:hypothetical protein